MKVEVVLTEADLAQEFTDAFERAICREILLLVPALGGGLDRSGGRPDLYGGLAATWKELGSSAIELASHFHGRVPVISFGAGDGARDALLLGP